MKKRILSIVLAVLMLLSVMPVTALAAEESVVPQNVVTAEQGGVKVEKRAEWTDEKNGKAKITFTLIGGTMTSQDIPETDIVLVIDKSGSMGTGKDSKMDKAKTAAKDFVDKFFGTGADQGYKDKVQIAVVFYSDSATTDVGLTNQKDLLISAISDISANGGTHIQAGIHRAQQILDADKREKVKKLIVVLSDGEPTYSYLFTATGTFTECTKLLTINCNARLTSHGAFTADYSKTIGDGTSFSGMETDNGLFGLFDWNWGHSGNVSVSGTCNKNHDTTQHGAYAVNGTFTADGSSNHGVGTIWEANQAKANGTEIFAVGFDIGNSGNAYDTMTGVATDAEHYKSATTTDISFVFETIATTITKAIAKDVVLTDPLGTGFTLTGTEGGETYSRNIGELSETKKIEFEIQYDTAHPVAGEMLQTNNDATLTYKDANGTPRTIKIGNPELENLAKKVTYIDENDNVYTGGAYQEKLHWYGDTVTLAPAPQKDGYTFSGWTTSDVAIGENDNTFEMPKQNVTLKASWTKNEPTTKTITVTKVWDKDVTDAQKQPVVITLYQKVGMGTVNPETDYYDSITLNGTETAPWTGVFKDLPLKNDKDEKYGYAVVETRIGTLQVTNGSANVIRMNEDGESAYTVGTWFVNSSMTPAEPNTYYITNTYTSKPQYTLDYQFVGNAPTGVDEPVGRSDCYEGEKITLTAMQKVTGWKFDGWYSDDTCTTKVNDPYRMPAGNVTLYGKWTQEKLDVTTTKTATRTRGDELVVLPNNGTVRVGDTITYSVTFENTGNTALGKYGVLNGVEEFLGQGSMEYELKGQKVTVGNANNGGSPHTFKIADINEFAPNAKITYVFTYEVTETDETAGTITNKAYAKTSVLNPGATMPSTKFFPIAKHEVTVEQRHTVEYQYETTGLSADVVEKLPQLPADNEKYYADDKVLVKNESDDQTIGGIKYTFDGWYESNTTKYAGGSEYTMGETNVTFVGKWTKEEQQPETATLRFEFKSGMEGKDLPAGMPTEPKDVTEEVGKEVQLTNYTETVNDEENIGKWTFVGWYTDADCTEGNKVTSPYAMPAGGGTLYGKWTFTKDEPADTTLTIAYYLMHADGTYPSEATDSATTNGKVGEDFTAEPMKTAYDDKGYVFDEDAVDNRISGNLVLEPEKNVFKLYYKALPGLEVTKTITDVTRDGEPLNPIDPEVEVKEGDVIEYEITVRSSGKLNLTNVVLTDEFTGAEGDLTFISGDDYTVDGYEITLKNDLNVGDRVTIKATYEVQLGDSGYEISNKAIGTAKDALKREVTGESRPVGITPDALKAYRIFGSVYKYVKSEKGTFNKDGETVPFEFKVTSDKKGEEILDTFTIDVEETVKAGETSEGDWGGFDFNLSEEEFENLDKKEFNGKEYPVVYLWELKGNLKNMSYSTKRITLYLDMPDILFYSEREPVTEYLGARMAYANPDEHARAEITNIYGKESSSSDTVKVGPQLNRDDHVAYIMGYPDGTVQPEGQITRAEACTIFFRLLTDSSRDYYFARTNDYSDVNAGDWFNNAISTLSNAGIVTGYNDGTFRPNQPITRGEMAKIIANFANLKYGGKTFTDLAGHWSKSYVELAAGNGWIAGYPDGSFRPDQKITRAETVTMINRVLDRVPAKESRLLSRSIMLTFPDNKPGDWYYIAIQEASNSHEYRRSVYETTGDEMWTKLIDNVDWTKLEK